MKSGSSKIIISENFSFPFDEGSKKILLYLYDVLGSHMDWQFITELDNDTKNFDIKKISLGKFFLSTELRRVIKDYSPDFIVYLPEASYTFNSFLRAKIFKLLNKKSKVIVIGNQKRRFNKVFSYCLKFLKPDLLFIFDENAKDFFSRKNFNVKIIPPVVDLEKFIPAKNDLKRLLRQKYGFKNESKIVLHVGHLKGTRNVERLIDIQKMDGFQAILVGSTSTQQDYNLKERLRKKGLVIMDSYIENIEEVYQLSDIYYFPVEKDNAAVDMPLSILEAMACNLPVVTTTFGALNNYFDEDKYFRYYDTLRLDIDLIKNIPLNNVNNREKVKCFSRSNLANTIIKGCNNLL